MRHKRQHKNNFCILFIVYFVYSKYTSARHNILNDSTWENHILKLKKIIFTRKQSNKNWCNILNKDALFNIFLHEFLVEFRTQCVVNKAFLFSGFIHSFGAVLKHDIIVPPARLTQFHWRLNNIFVDTLDQLLARTLDFEEKIKTIYSIQCKSYIKSKKC